MQSQCGACCAPATAGTPKPPTMYSAWSRLPCSCSTRDCSSSWATLRTAASRCQCSSALVASASCRRSDSSCRGRASAGWAALIWRTAGARFPFAAAPHHTSTQWRLPALELPWKSAGPHLHTKCEACVHTHLSQLPVRAGLAVPGCPCVCPRQLVKLQARLRLRIGEQEVLARTHRCTPSTFEPLGTAIAACRSGECTLQVQPCPAAPLPHASPLPASAIA